MTQPLCPECGRPMIFLDANMEFYCPECRDMAQRTLDDFKDRA
jgi:tRNA(Ile2) C34 agmatinyltransferase TiaS